MDNPVIESALKGTTPQDKSAQVRLKPIFHLNPKVVMNIIRNDIMEQML